MRTFTNYQSNFGTISRNANTSNVTLGMTLVNDALRVLVNKFYFNERIYTTKTKANQQFYYLPPQFRKMIDLTVTVGDVLWLTKPAPNREYWDSLNVINFNQNYPSYHFIYNGNQVGIWPTPASSGETITINYQTRLRDISQADYTTGTVTLPLTAAATIAPPNNATSLTLSASWTLPTDSYQIVFASGEIRTGTFTNGSTAVTWSDALTSAETSTALTIQSEEGGTIVTGSGTTFIADMASGLRWLNVTPPTGDDQWYQIGEYVDATHLALLNPYTGSSVAGGAFTIGEVPILPEDYQDLPLYRALEVYFTSIVPDSSSAELYQGLYERGYAQLEQDYGSKTTSPVLTDTDASVYNPNLFVRSVSQTN